MGMTQPKANDKIVFTYKGMLDNGEVFISSEKDQPAQVILGQSELPPTLESGIMTMQVGQTKKIRIPPEEGYGPRMKDLIQSIESQQLVDTLKPKPGMIVSLKVDKDGVEQKVPATVMEVAGTKITVDYNHPLAGHHLTYQITLLAIEDPQKSDA
jgi:FKBP-type peptidyl-prolyl cis-trans isomerase SlpA